MDNLTEILEFVDSVHYQGGELRKSHVKATVRHMKSGKAVAVKEHEDKRPVRELSAKEKAGWLKHKQESSVNPKYHEKAEDKSIKTGADLEAHVATQIRSHFDEGYTFKKEYPVTLQANGRTLHFIGRKDKIGGPIKLARLAGDRVMHYVLSDGKNALTEKGSTFANDYAKEQFEKVLGDLNKSLIHAFKRLLSSGKQVMVQEHTDNRQPRGDFASTSTLASLGDAARERSASVKPFVSFKEQLKTVPIERLHILRDKINRLSHNGLMREHQGRPIMHWMAAIDAEMGRREKETTSTRASVAGGELGSGNKAARSFAGLTGMSGTPRQISLAKSHVSASIRHTASGKTVIIKEHNRENSGAFYHKETGKRFEYQPTTHPWNKEQGATHEIEVRFNPDGSGGKRGAIVSKTVAHVIVDEDDNGNAVWEKWPLKDHHVYTKK